MHTYARVLWALLPLGLHPCLARAAEADSPSGIVVTAAPSHNTNLTGTIRATPDADTNLYVTGMWHSLSLRDLVWSGTSNRRTAWRIAFGGDRVLGMGKLAPSALPLEITLGLRAHI